MRILLQIQNGLQHPGIFHPAFGQTRRMDFHEWLRILQGRAGHLGSQQVEAREHIQRVETTLRSGSLQELPPQRRGHGPVAPLDQETLRSLAPPGILVREASHQFRTRGSCQIELCVLPLRFWHDPPDTTTVRRRQSAIECRPAAGDGEWPSSLR